MTEVRIVAAGDSVLVAEFEDRIDIAVNAQAVAMADALRRRQLPGLRDVVPTFRSVAVYFDPLATDVERLVEQMRAAAALPEEGRAVTGAHVDVPVCYDPEFGLDLDDVARSSGLGREEVIAAHSGRDYRVFMLGFVPGFAYLGILDARISVPRRPAPRTSVPAGSVAVAGEQTAVYPSQIPGGWNIVGRTPLQMLSLDQSKPSLLEAGDSVRFRIIDRQEFDRIAAVSGSGIVNTWVDVLTPGLQTTVQDLGRWGHQSAGVPVAGPMDPFAHRRANALVNNGRLAATLEVTLIGPALRFVDSRAFAVAGGPFELFLDDAPFPCDRVGVARSGSVLRFGSRVGGARAYLAVAGGFDVPVVLGSRATHVSTGTGGWQGRALVRGDRLPLGPAHEVVGPARVDVRSAEPQEGTAVLRVLPGPQQDRFAPDAIDALVSAPYRVEVESDRMGFRLAGPMLRHRGHADIISDATPVGSLQVPSSGQPLLLMADRQTTGGYAKLATVITADIGIAGQAAPGDLLQFRICSRAEALTALVARERPLLALESRTA